MKTVRLFLCFTWISMALTEDNVTLFTNQRTKRVLPIFGVVRFPNDICGGTNGFNGTCFTNDECSSAGGLSSGTCANGFGICCTFLLGCGSTSSQNNSYLVQTATTALSNNRCTYTICPISNSVCRIRFDFTSFVLAVPPTDVLDSGTITGGSALGDCVTDSFSISSPGNTGSPIICGTNTGQHMIVDSSSSCVKVNFNLGSTTPKSWNIKVTQYPCGENLGGPPDCLQYFVGSDGIISSYNFPLGVPITTAQHLSDQFYNICIRRESGFCFICYTPTVSASAAIAFASFGLSKSAAAGAAQSQVNELCSTDYIIIPGGIALPAGGTIPNTAVPTTSRNCGRFLNPLAGETSNVSVCTRLVPFRITLKTDSTEITTNAAGSNTHELKNNPTGTIGFSLKYSQTKC